MCKETKTKLARVLQETERERESNWHWFCMSNMVIKHCTLLSGQPVRRRDGDPGRHFTGS